MKLSIEIQPVISLYSVGGNPAGDALLRRVDIEERYE